MHFWATFKERMWVTSPTSFGSSVTNGDSHMGETNGGSSSNSVKSTQSYPRSQIGQSNEDRNPVPGSGTSLRSIQSFNHTEPPLFEKVGPSHTGRSQDSQDFHMTARHYAAFTVLMMALCACALDYSATGNIMGTIAHDLGGTTSQTEWIGNGYSLTACVFQLPISTFSEIFGRRNVFMVVLALFFIGSLICATAPNMEALIAGRVIQGAGGGGCLVLPEVILADTIPLRQRSLYYAIFMIVWCVFSGVAPMVAGALSEYSSWRWFFYMNLFIIGIAFVLTPLSLRLKSHDEHWRERLRKVDVGGAVLTIASTTSLLLALSRGGSSASLPWSHWSVILPLVLGFCGLIATGFYEYFTHQAVPMFNFRVFGNLSANICYVHNILQGITNMATIYFLPTFFQGAKGYGQLKSGAAILPLNLIGAPISLLLGYVVEKSGHYQLVNLSMWALSTLGVGLFMYMDGHQAIAGLVCLQIPASIGISCLYSTLSTTANATNPPHLWTESTAMMSFCRSIGDALGTAIGGAILASQLRSRIAMLQATDGVSMPDNASVLSIVNIIDNVDSPAIQAALKDILTRSLHTVFLVVTIFCAVALFLTLFQREYSLDQEYESKQGIDQD